MASDADGPGLYTAERGDLSIQGIPGEHALFARQFEDGSGPATWSFHDREEIEWAIRHLQNLSVADGETVSNADTADADGDDTQDNSRTGENP